MARIRKALTAALIAGATAVSTAAADGTITGNDWWIILGALVVGGVGVYWVPNATAPVKPPQ